MLTVCLCRSDRCCCCLMHRCGKLPRVHLLRKPVYLPPRVTENDCLGDRHRLYVLIAAGTMIPFSRLRTNGPRYFWPSRSGTGLAIMSSSPSDSVSESEIAEMAWAAFFTNPSSSDSDSVSESSTPNQLEDRRKMFVVDHRPSREASACASMEV